MCNKEYIKELVWEASVLARECDENSEITAILAELLALMNQTTQNQ